MEYALQLKEITKTYPGVKALDRVCLSVLPGEVHAIIGENGAGKSTLIKTVAGAIQPDSGTIQIGDEVFTSLTPAKAREKGVGVIYQEFNLVDSLSIADNVYLGSRTGSRFFQNKRLIHEKTSEILREFNLDLDTHAAVGTVSTAKQQMVEIVKALSQNAKIMIMDEPSAAISIADVEVLFRVIRKLKQKGVAIIYISHRMDEIFDIADRVTIMRDGRYIATKGVHEVSRKELISMMVGREFEEKYPSRKSAIGETVLEARNISGNGDHNLSFQLRKGEILGFAGLVGAGRTEMGKMLFGEYPIDSGELYVKGRKVRFRTTKAAIDAGIGLIPEDRRHEGAFQEFSIEWNIQIMALRRMSRMTFVDRKQTRQCVDDYFKKLRIVAPSPQQLVRNLSGGNQQKVVLAKVLATKADILIFDEPTRGIDVSAKQEIYRLMNELVAQGMSIIMISSEMDELLGMSDRVIVMRHGMISGELKKENFSQNNVMTLAAN